MARASLSVVPKIATVSIEWTRTIPARESSTTSTGELCEESEILSELEQAQSNLEKTKKAVPYTPDTISSYLNNTIREFNESNASDDKMARYVINSMDVDLKVRVFDDSENDKDSPIKFVAPKVSETSEDSLSSLKISIQAVPK